MWMNEKGDLNFNGDDKSKLLNKLKIYCKILLRFLDT